MTRLFPLSHASHENNRFNPWRREVRAERHFRTAAATVAPSVEARVPTQSVRTRCYVLLLCLSLAGSIQAQESKAPVFELHSADGATITGPLERVSDDWSISLGESQGKQVKGMDVIALRRSNTPLPVPPREEHVRFANGDCIPGKVIQIDGERLRLRARFQSRSPFDSGQELTVPLPALTTVWFTAPDGADDVEMLSRALTAERRRCDKILLRNSDIVEGTLNGLDEKTLRVEIEGSGKPQPTDVKIERERVAAIALNTELARAPRAKGVHGRVVLRNGCRLSLNSAHTEDGQSLLGKTPFGVSARIPSEQIVALDLRGGRAVYLSDLKPSRYEHTPFFGIHWPYVVDGSVAGRDLRLGGSTYDTGIGMHSESRLTFDLGGAYQRFEALVGLDDKTGRRGNVFIQVLVDGKPQDVGEKKNLTGQDPPRAIRVGVAGAGELTLVVKFGHSGDVQDHVNWVDTRLIK